MSRCGAGKRPTIEPLPALSARQVLSPIESTRNDLPPPDLTTAVWESGASFPKVAMSSAKLQEDSPPYRCPSPDL